MLQLFSKNHFFNTLLFLPLVIVLRFAAFVREDVYMLSVNKGGYLGEIFVDLMSGYPILSALLACFLVFIQIVIINRITIINKLSHTITLYSGMVYMILTMLEPEMLVFSPALISATFILVAVSYLMRAFKIANAPAHVFNTGFWMAVASLCYSSLIVFFIWGYICFVILRRFRGVEGLRYFIGFSIPYVWTLVLVFSFGNLPEFFNIHFVENIGIPSFNIKPNAMAYIPVIMFGLLAMFSALNYRQINTKKSIHAQKKISILYWFLAAAVVSALFTNNLDLTHLFFIAIPLSYFLSETLTLMENKSIGELIMWIFVLTGIILQYGILV